MNNINHFPVLLSQQIHAERDIQGVLRPAAIGAADLTDQNSRALARDWKTIDQSATVLAADQERDKFAELWGEKVPTMVNQGRLQGSDMIVLFEFPPAIRKAIDTTNVIESVNSVNRKYTRNRKQDSNGESALKLVSLAIPEASQKGTMPIVGWQAALNPFGIMFAERMPGAGKSECNPPSKPS